MNLRHTFSALTLAVALTAAAVPADRHRVVTFSQPDGTTIDVRNNGDENFHFLTTSDGLMLSQDADGRLCYATLSAEGMVVSSGITARNENERTATDMAMLSSIDQSRMVKTLAERAVSTKSLRTNNRDGQHRFSYAFPTKGSPRSIVILVEYADVSFSMANPREYFNNILNVKGYKDSYGTNGSALDFFEVASSGQFTPQFDIYGPVKLPQRRSYYGENDEYGSDKYPRHMVRDAAQILDDEVDFSIYDTDGDGDVENVYIFYAGKGEADSSQSDLVWPHNSTITGGFSFDGVKIKRYACSNELRPDRTPVSIGTFVHEFSHVLGLPDLYDIYYTHYTTPDKWSVLDSGPYSNNGCTPPTYSSFERNACGWMGDNLIELTAGKSVTLGNLHDTNTAFLVNATDDDDEYFLIEFRSRTGWDRYLPNDGMLVWHIRYDRDRWNRNMVNTERMNQLVDIVEASNKVPSDANDYVRNAEKYLPGYCFPGTSNRTCFTYDGVVEDSAVEPYFATYRDADLGLPITNIRLEDGCLKFDVCGGGEELDLSSIQTVAADNAVVSVEVDGLTVKAEGVVTLTDVAGRVVATGTGSATAPAPGMYIVTTGAGVAKVVLK